MDLDHVAIALHDVTEPLSILVGELGATILYGGQTAGFRPVSVFLGDGHEGMQVELLEPWEVETNDFLARFLAKHGEGPHHLTFKVKDLASEVERVRRADYEPVGIDLDSPWWKEAFIHPKQAHGTVVQLAQSSWEMPSGGFEELIKLRRAEGPDADRRWWTEPPPRAEREVVLKRVVMSTPSLEEASAFFSGLLLGRMEAAGKGWTDLVWPGGGRIRIEQRDDRAPGIDRLECVHAGPRVERTIGGSRFVLLSPTS